MKAWPDLRHKMMRSLRREDCQRILNIFPTASGRRKARIILHGICAFACRRGWAGKNPAAETPCPLVKERRVPVLTPEDYQSKEITWKSSNSAIARLNQRSRCGASSNPCNRLPA